MHETFEDEDEDDGAASPSTDKQKPVRGISRTGYPAKKI
jgi:hypothetical protein